MLLNQVYPVRPAESIKPGSRGVGGLDKCFSLQQESCSTRFLVSAANSKKQNSVLQWLERNRKYVVEVLQKLIQVPSVYPDEGEAQALVRSLVSPLCDKTDVWEPDVSALESHPAYFAKGRPFKDRPNVVGILEGSGKGRSLLLNAHIDVVPPQPDDEWPHPPWKGEIHDGKVYGRGSLDDKSGVAIMIAVAKALREADVKLRGSLQLHSVVDEEWGGAGTLACMQRGHKTDAGIILEPVGPGIYPASRGGQAFRVRVRGKGAHPGACWTGVSALEKAILIMQGLKQLEADRNRNLRTPLFAEYPIFIPIVVGKISADNIPSKVPEECIFEGLYGYAPQEHWSEARLAFEGHIAATAATDGWLAEHRPEVSWPGLNKEGAEIPIDHPLVLCLRDAVKDVSGEAPHVAGFPAGTDLPLLVLYGHVPSVLYGVASEWGQAHSSTEHVEIEHLLEAVRCVAVAAMQWCGIAD
jgi:acetylornithine deacetylase